jgi:hypothetical protein
MHLYHHTSPSSPLSSSSSSSSSPSSDSTLQVSTSFSRHYPTHSYNFQRVEASVEVDFRNMLASRCGKEKQRKRQRQLQASWGSEEAKEQARIYPTPSCGEYDRYFVKRAAGESASTSTS